VPTDDERLEGIEDKLAKVLAILQAKELVKPNQPTGPFNTNPLAGQYRPSPVFDATLWIPPKRGDNIYKIVAYLPDRAGTPGATNPDVTNDPAVIKATIGTPGWTATVRPPVSYTDPLKLQVMREYGMIGNPDKPDVDPKDVELDHLVPLCCGGHPTSQLNLWPQPREGQWGASTKDLTEVAAMHAILRGLMTLENAQIGFMTDWIGLHNRLFSNVKLMTLMAALPPPEPEP
jgi:hypothetical protein